MKLFNKNTTIEKPPIITPIMELFDKYIEQNVQCSIDEGSPPVPEGSKLFFKKHGFLIIKNFLDPKELYCEVPNERGMFKYYGSQQVGFEPVEGYVPGSLGRYGYPKYKDVHVKVGKFLEEVLGEELYRTYYYDRFYFVDQDLRRHKDRDSCEVSVTVQVSSNSPDPWPISLQTLEGKEVSVNLENGSALVYMGCDLDHWRYPLESRYTTIGKILNKISFKPDDTYHHQLFLHYVLANGSRSHHKGDLRDT